MLVVSVKVVFTVDMCMPCETVDTVDLAPPQLCMKGTY